MGFVLAGFGVTKDIEYTRFAQSHKTMNQKETALLCLIPLYANVRKMSKDQQVLAEEKKHKDLASIAE